MASEAPRRPEGLAAYLVVTAAYWAFMLSDGALRMLVLLYLHDIGYAPSLIDTGFLWADAETIDDPDVQAVLYD